MTALATDDFNRANNADLGTNWTPLTTTFVSLKILSNEAANSTSASGCVEYWSGALVGGGAWPNNQYAEITVGSVVETSTDNGPGGAVRINPSGGGDTAYFSQTNTHETRLYRCVAGSIVQLGSDGVACTTGDTLRATASGTTISSSKNGSVIIGPVTDASIASGSAGIFCASPTTSTANAWAAGDLSTDTSLSPSFGAITINGVIPSLARSQQYLRPSSDISAGTWLPSTGANLYAMLDEIAPDNSDYDYTPTASAMTVKFSSGTDPVSSTGHIVRYRINGTLGSILVVDLKQGASIIKTWTHSPAPNIFTTYEQTLSGAEADSITDYTDLRLTVTAS